MTWVRDNLKAAAAIVIGVLLILLTLWLTTCSSARDAKTEAKLNAGQAGAAIESGKDAAGTVGKRADADSQTDATTRENDAAIRNAEGAGDPVAAPVRDAGLRALCRRAAYRDTPRCKDMAK